VDSLLVSLACAVLRALRAVVLLCSYGACCLYLVLRSRLFRFSFLPFPLFALCSQEAKKTHSIGLEHRNKRHGAPGGTGHLVACPLAGLGDGAWSGMSGREGMGRIVPTAPAGPSEVLPPASLVL
jgi:hypothetical protein